MAEFKLSYTANDINEKLGKIEDFPSTAKGTSENSFIANDLTTNKVHSANSTVFGENSTAGTKGYYIQSIEILKDENGVTVGGNIYLSNSTDPVIPTRDNHQEDTSVVLPYTLGDEDSYFSVESNGYYHWIHVQKITAIRNNVISYEGIIEPANYWELGEPNHNQEQLPFCFFVESQPNEGIINFGNHSHAEGWYASALASQSHAEGYMTKAVGRYSHAEGFGTLAGYAAHSEGGNTEATGLNSHAEGNSTVASGTRSHAEGEKTIASGHYSHSEGRETQAIGPAAHAEGRGTVASGQYSHVEGFETVASGDVSHAEGMRTVASGTRSHAEGNSTEAAGKDSHVQGRYNIIDTETDPTDDTYGKYAHIVGNGTDKNNRSNAHTLDWSGNAWFAGTIKAAENIEAEGNISSDTIYATRSISADGSIYTSEDLHASSDIYANGNISADCDIFTNSDKKVATEIYVDKSYTIAGQKSDVTIGKKATAEGYSTDASGEYAHAEGSKTTASGKRSHAEGYESQALSNDAHAEGYKTTAGNTTSGGIGAHAEGASTQATANASHAEGRGTIASSSYQHAQGKYNIEDTSATYAHIVGNGTSDTARSNAHTLDWDGNAWFAGDVESGNGKLATEAYVNEQIDNIEIPETDLIGYATEDYVNSRYVTAGQKTGATLGEYATAEGVNTTASGNYSHAEGNGTTASGQYSHAEGFHTTASGVTSHAEGDATYAIGIYSHAEGSGDINSYSVLLTGEAGTTTYTISDGGYIKVGRVINYGLKYATIKTYDKQTLTITVDRTLNTSEELNSTKARVYVCGAFGAQSHSEGLSTIAYGMRSHAEGAATTASGDCSHTEGLGTIAFGNYQHVQGKYNIEDVDGAFAHIVGNGDYNNPSNALTVSWEGNGVISGSWSSSTGADYAEYFEWADGNTNNEDRVGYIVALDGDKIRLATSDDEDILGIISGTAAIIGDTASWDWQDKYLTDEFGRTIFDMVEEFIEVPEEVTTMVEETVETTDENGNIVTETIEVPHTEIQMVTKSTGFFPHRRLNPAYDETQTYVPRSERKEWDTVGMIGKLHVRDDGTCQPNGYAKVGKNGIATLSDTKTNMRVLRRITDNIVLVLMK